MSISPWLLNKDWEACVRVNYYCINYKCSWWIFDIFKCRWWSVTFMKTRIFMVFYDVDLSPHVLKCVCFFLRLSSITPKMPTDFAPGWLNPSWWREQWQHKTSSPGVRALSSLRYSAGTMAPWHTGTLSCICCVCCHAKLSNITSRTHTHTHTRQHTHLSD